MNAGKQEDFKPRYSKEWGPSTLTDIGRTWRTFDYRRGQNSEQPAKMQIAAVKGEKSTHDN